MRNANIFMARFVSGAPAGKPRPADPRPGSAPGSARPPSPRRRPERRAGAPPPGAGGVIFLLSLVEEPSRVGPPRTAKRCSVFPKHTYYIWQ